MEELLASVKQISSSNAFFQSKQEMTSLLRMAFNEILTCCCATIHFQAIFSDNVETVISALDNVSSPFPAGLDTSSYNLSHSKTDLNSFLLFLSLHAP